MERLRSLWTRCWGTARAIQPRYIFLSLGGVELALKLCWQRWAPHTCKESVSFLRATTLHPHYPTVSSVSLNLYQNTCFSDNLPKFVQSTWWKRQTWMEFPKHFVQENIKHLALGFSHHFFSKYSCFFSWKVCNSLRIRCSPTFHLISAACMHFV